MRSKSIIHPNSTIEENVQLGAGSIVEPNVSLRGKTMVGKGCYFSAGSSVQGPARIGDHVFFGGRVFVGFPIQRQIQLFQKGKKESPWENSDSTEIGDYCIIRTGSVIYSGSRLGDNVRMGHNALIREQVEIGDNTLVGTGVIIEGHSTIGKKVSIQSNVYIPSQTQIEDHVFLGPNCVLTNDKYVMRRDYELKGPIIRKGASIGAGAIILPAIEIGAKAVVGAGAVVTKDVPPKAIVYGTPAKVRSTVPDSWKIPLE